MLSQTAALLFRLAAGVVLLFGTPGSWLAPFQQTLASLASFERVKPGTEGSPLQHEPHTAADPSSAGPGDIGADAQGLSRIVLFYEADAVIVRRSETVLLKQIDQERHRS
jgi:hypothetical protein